MPADDLHAARARAITKEKSKLAYTLDKPLVTILCTFSISVLPRVLLRVELWAFTILHIIFFLLKREGIWVFDVGNSGGLWTIPLSMSALGIPAGLMSLLLVFFNSQCFGRYMSFYGACTGMGGTVQELAQLSSAYVPAAAAVARWDACRYLLASVLIVYMKATDIARNRPPKVDPEDWERLTMSEDAWVHGVAAALKTTAAGGVGMPALLDRREEALLKKCAGRESHVLQMWALETMRAAYQAGGAEHQMWRVEETVLTCRRHCAAIPNILDMPVPFPYYHLLCSLMFVNYFLFAITFLEMDSWLTPVALFLIIVTTTGVRELSSALANPFGDDEVDFNSSKSVHKLRSLITFLAHPGNATLVQLPYVRGATYGAAPLRQQPPPSPTSAAVMDETRVDSPPQRRAALEAALAQQRAEIEQLQQMMAERQRLEMAPQPTPQPPPQPQFQQPHAQVDDEALRRELHAEQARIYELRHAIHSHELPRSADPATVGYPFPGAAQQPAAGGGGADAVVQAVSPAGPPRKLQPIAPPALSSGGLTNRGGHKSASVAPAVKPASVASALPSYQLEVGQGGATQWRPAPPVP